MVITFGAVLLLGAVLQVPTYNKDIAPLVAQRCAMCHNAGLANKNVRLDTPELIAKNAQALYQQAVVAKTMPLNNATQITEAERAALGRWVQGGAKLE